MSENVNQELCQLTSEILKKLGVREIVICGGSRNAPLIFYFAKDNNFKLYSHFEERSAGFFALGRATESARPVAVLCTSGTAAANLLPSLIEAHYSRVPIIAITADRPKIFRNSGAPQSIEQADLFGVYVEKTFDLDKIPSSLSLDYSLEAPLHLNICLSEPLSDYTPSSDFSLNIKNASPTPSPLSSSQKKSIEEKLGTFKKPLVIVSKISLEARQSVIDFLLKFRAPVYLEACSQLREESSLQNLRIKSSEKALAFENWDGVLKIGAVPHLRFWRDLDEKLASLPLISLGESPFSGSPRAQHYKMNLENLASLDVPSVKADLRKFYELDRWFLEQKQELYSRFPCSEASLIYKFSRVIENHALVYLGNSLPIREWDLVADSKARDRWILANRGANGIDGQVSTFLGLCSNSRPNWALLGDITLMYDMSSLLLKQRLPEDIHFQICVINNKGGRIFSRLPQWKDSKLESPRKQFLETEHSLEFSPLAQMYSLAYEKWTGQNPLSSPGPQSLIEICPDPEESFEFWREYDALWRTQ